MLIRLSFFSQAHFLSFFIEQVGKPPNFAIIWQNVLKTFHILILFNDVFLLVLSMVTFYLFIHASQRASHS
jgi:hypothetical protein